jgi:hypothetical protein
MAEVSAFAFRRELWAGLALKSRRKSFELMRDLDMQVAWHSCPSRS